MTVEHTPSPYGPRDGGNAGGRHFNEPHWQDEYFPAEAQDIDVADLLLAMEALTERQRFVIECRFGLRAGAEGRSMSQREIARLLGVHHRAVEKHEQAGLARLRTRLAATTTPPPA
jgi:DNA-directed RNA polymerase specialized sigma subunit